MIDTIGGAEGDRTPDLMNAIHALSQLSYGPVVSVRRQWMHDRGESDSVQTNITAYFICVVRI